MKTILYLFFFFAMITGQVAFAGNPSDTAKKVLIADLSKKPEAIYITKQPNIVFPDILKGNETQAIDYVKDFSTRRREYIIRTYTRGKKILAKAATILKKHQVPQELKVLVALESAYNPNAVSSAGAVGYWQFMDAVAKEYGLKYAAQLTPEAKEKLIKKNPATAAAVCKALDKQKDDRKDFLKSTQAAARYLKDRTRNLGNDWLLIVASYNCGVGNVWDAMAKSKKVNPTFWDVQKYLPDETQAYVMNFITLNVIFNNYDKFVKNTLTYFPEKVMVDNFEQNITTAITE